MRASLLTSFALAVLGTLITPPAVQAQYPTRPPAPLPLAELPFPPFVEFELENGLRVVVVQSAKQPVLSLRLSVLGGSLYDSEGKSGTADLVAGLLTKGAGGRTAEQIAQAIERVGGSLVASASADFLTIEASVLSTDRELAVELLADALLRPNFPPSELELLRTQTISALALARSQPAAIAERIFAGAVYGEHPYGRRATETTVRAVTREDLQQFHRDRVRPAQGLLVMAGAIDSTEAHRLAQGAFGAWAGRGAPTPPARPAPQRALTEILLVDRPGSVQSNIVIGNTTWLPTDTRGYAMAMANQILGGASDSRLFTILREEKGWTYGAYSGAARTRGIGTWNATAEVRTEVTDSAVVEMLRQMRRLAVERVPTEEFFRHQQTLVGRFPLQTETAAQVAQQVATARLLGLATDYVQTYRDRIEAVSPEAVQATARSGMRADAALIVVVGDGAALRESLERIAPVTVLSPDGAPRASATAAGGTLPLPLERERMRAGTDSFTVMVQGQEFGYQVTELRRSLDGWEYVEQSTLGPIIQQRTSVEFSDALVMRSTEQGGRFQGNDLKLSVRYRDGRVSGEGVTPGAQGMQNVRYEGVVVPPGVIDDNLLLGLLSYVAWTPDATYAVPVFASGKGTVEQRILRVAAEEVISVPLGTFAAYRVEYEGGEAPGTYWIESKLPFRVLKFGPVGVPLEIVRVR
jgi:zinc protease